ncbi:hypothetical protein BH09SUM1_BH09SUM1_20120 [soil metagenome]
MRLSGFQPLAPPYFLISSESVGMRILPSLRHVQGLNAVSSRTAVGVGANAKGRANSKAQTSMSAPLMVLLSRRKSEVANEQK